MSNVQSIRPDSVLHGNDVLHIQTVELGVHWQHRCRDQGDGVRS